MRKVIKGIFSVLVLTTNVGAQALSCNPAVYEALAESASEGARLQIEAAVVDNTWRIRDFTCLGQVLDGYRAARNQVAAGVGALAGAAGVSGFLTRILKRTIDNTVRQIAERNCAEVDGVIRDVRNSRGGRVGLDIVEGVQNGNSERVVDSVLDSGVLQQGSGRSNNAEINRAINEILSGRRRR